MDAVPEQPARDRTGAAAGAAGGAVIEGRYRILGELGRGGFGAVYRAARLDPPGGEVALKVLDPCAAGAAASDVGEFVARFVREVKNAQRLDHPAAVKVLDWGSLPDRRLFYAMELCPGASLKALLVAGGPMAPVRLVPLAREALAALGAAHALGMVHRDVKPANIQVVRGADGIEHAKLLDFGLAKIGGAGRASQELTAQGRIYGTIAYMPPEQVLGRPLDGRADLYAMAASLFEMLSGRVPFEGEGEELMRAIVYDDPPDLARTTGGRVGPALAAAVARGLAKRREDRFPSAEEMAAALAAAAPPGTAARPALLAGRYALRRPAAEDRRGTLYEAWDELERRPVALEVLAVRGAVPDDDLLRYARGVSALVRIAHPNVVRFLGSGATPEGRPFFVMEWVPGRALAEFLRERGRVPVPEATGAISQVLAGLEAAHAAGVIHRNVTPRHILVVPTDAGAVVKLGGFGLAKGLAGEDSFTRWSPAIGEPAYMSPEQLRGERLDERADVWSAGVVLFEMVAGRRPFAGASAGEVARAVLGGEGAPGTTGVPALDAVLARALARDRAARFPGAAAFRAALVPLAGALARADLAGMGTAGA